MAVSEPHRDEKTSASRWFSPGLVQDDEIILRTIWDPHHFKDGNLSTTAAISLEDLRFRGWSVDRKRYTSLWRLKRAHRKSQIQKANLRRCYVIPIGVGNIRTDCNGAFLVVDDALWKNPAHSAVLLSAKSSEVAARKARDLLMRTLPPYIDVANAFLDNDRWGWSRGIALEIIAMFRAAIRSVFSTFFANAKIARP
jgi:hypothetical protein